ncbi:MAG: hypothetical protein LPK88_11300 [Alphaproteobacteria bacterium]|nr:hypothetical protein [Alphaproteobacteria bacterium]MDX5416884.1 hypothetical protein [Alphaproteobacteria bacterium]MDX5494279.1 hypothetical protein [Alphaproteobacteria bacterium]
MELTTMKSEISLERLEAIIDAYGASPMRWPAGERAAAEALLAASVEARSLLADARMLDGMLAAAPVEAPSDALVARLMAARPRGAAAPAGPARPQGFFRELVASVWPYGSPVLPAGALAASIMLGVALGSVSEFTVIDGGLTASASEEADTDDRLIALALADITWPEEWM